MDWFEKLFGFAEKNPEQVRENLSYENGMICSKVNGKCFGSGTFELASLAELRKIQIEDNGPISLSEVIGDVKKLHGLPENNGAVFQAASQFNLLEMASPNAIPEYGVGIYESDHTQGPACAIACGAGTVYRNYFVEVNGEIGQSRNNQIDCLEVIETYFQNDEVSLWKMKNGYCLATAEGLLHIDYIMKNLDNAGYEDLKGMLKVGIQNNAEVTAFPGNMRVSQVYCSGVPVAYSGRSASSWEKFGRIVLEATYEATFLTAVRKLKKEGNRKLFLTLVGGGVFGNPDNWLYDAILYNLKKFENSGLDIIFVSYGASNTLVQKMIRNYKSIG